MVRLYLLGKTDLRDTNGSELRSVLAQPKRFALLAYLAATNRSSRRDHLLALFWPEHSQDRARKALNKSVYFLREALGDAAIVSRNAEELSSEPTVVWCDVVAFASAVAEQRHAEAMELYLGELLPAFHIDEAPDFAHWMDEERSRCRRLAGQAARRLAEEQEEQHQFTGAVTSARRALELAESDERVVRHLLELLDRVGDRAGALNVYDEFARRLATEYDGRPSAETQQLVAAIRARDHLVVAPPAAAASAPPTEGDALPGTTLADHYRIERRLGHGGMATVYLATDIRRGRQVAIKVLRPELAHAVGAERFLREIDITARLDHPHIVSLLDCGFVNGVLYYVMPFVEGESLRQRLNRDKQLSVHDALRVAREVADALGYAHARGVIHRDVKPENILLADGHARVADFGIAHAIEATAGAELTATGLSVGTPAYMSPEQAGGSKNVDARADIYSLACVTYEMLGGRPPFTGSTPQSIIRQHLVAEPNPVSDLRSSVSLQTAAAIGKGLAKNPADRFATAVELASALSGATEVAGASRRPRLARLRTVAPWIVAAVAITVAASLAIRPTGSSASTVRRFVIALPDSAPLAFVGSPNDYRGRRALAISRDGSMLAYVAAVGSTSMLYTRRLDEADVKPVPESEGAYSPFFSPDGRWLAFLTSSQVKRVSVSGGAPLTVATVDEPMDGAWLPDGRIVLCWGIRGSTAFVAPAGGELHTVQGWGCGYSLSPSSIGNRSLLVYSGRALQFFAPRDSAVQEVLGPDGKIRPAVPGEPGIAPWQVRAISPSFVGGSHLLFAQSGGAGTLLAMPFDSATMRATGDPVPVVPDVRVEATADGVAQYDVSNDGTLVYARGANDMLATIIFRDRLGNHDTLPLPRLDINRLEISPDRQRISAQVYKPGMQSRYVVFDVHRGTATQLVDSSWINCTWGGSSRSMLCGGHQGPDRIRLTVRVAIETGVVEDTLTRNGIVWSASSDESVLFVGRKAFLTDLWLVRRSAGGEQAVKVRGANNLSRISPSGEWIAMTVAGPGRPQIFIAPTSNPDDRHQISINGGEKPLWSVTEDRVFYRNRSQWYSVDISTRNGLTFAAPELLFDAPYHDVRGYSYALASDGRFALILGSPVRTTRRIEVVTGWFGELRRLSPPRRP